MTPSDTSDMLAALASLGFVQLVPMQQATIPHIRREWVHGSAITLIREDDRGRLFASVNYGAETGFVEREIMR